MQNHVFCHGAPTEAEYRAHLEAAGFVDIQFVDMTRVRGHAPCTGAPSRRDARVDVHCVWMTGVARLRGRTARRMACEPRSSRACALPCRVATARHFLWGHEEVSGGTGRASAARMRG